MAPRGRLTKRLERRHPPVLVLGHHVAGPGAAEGEERADVDAGVHGQRRPRPGLIEMHERVIAEEDQPERFHRRKI